MLLFCLLATAIKAEVNADHPQVSEKLKWGITFGCMGVSAIVMTIIGGVALIIMNRKSQGYVSIPAQAASDK